MKQYLAIAVLIFISCQRPTNELQLVKDVSTILNVQNATFAVAFKNLKTGEQLLINEHEIFHAASTMKTPVMAEVFKQVQDGKFNLSDSLTLNNKFKSIVDRSPFSLSKEDDSDEELYKLLGQKKSIESLTYDMIIVSSNLATNLIIELVDAKKVTEHMRAIGANDTKVLRGVEDGKAFDQGLNNVTSAYDQMLLFEKIAKGELVSKEYSKRMEDILLDQKFNEIIPAKLPKDVKVAHKTGSISGVRHDCGIVILPDGEKYVLVLLSKELKDEEAGIEAMAKVSKRIYDYLSSSK